jgi:hypothetical protein
MRALRLQVGDGQHDEERDLSELLRQDAEQEHHGDESMSYKWQGRALANGYPEFFSPATEGPCQCKTCRLYRTGVL